MNRIGKPTRQRTALWVHILVTLILPFALGHSQEVTAQSQWTTNGNDINNTNSGGVGIGTTSPQTRLQVSRDTPYTDYYGQLMLSPASNEAKRLVLGYDGTNDIGWIQAYHNAVGLKPLSLQPNGGNVGIGTTVPAKNLHVHDSGASSRFYLTNSNTGVTSGDGLLLEMEGTATAYLWNYENGPMYFGTNATARMTILAGGNVGIGTTNPTKSLHVVGDVEVTGNIAAKYQDIAEWVPAAHALPAGTVVVLNPAQSNQVMASTKEYDTRVAGVISERPGLALGEAGKDKVLVATTGRVKIKVDATRAPILVGDLLVTSDKEGVAMKSEPVSLGEVKLHRPGTLIGKALEPLEKGTGEILVLLSLQ